MEHHHFNQCIIILHNNVIKNINLIGRYFLVGPNLIQFYPKSSVCGPKIFRNHYKPLLLEKYFLNVKIFHFVRFKMKILHQDQSEWVVLIYTAQIFHFQLNQTDLT